MSNQAISSTDEVMTKADFVEAYNTFIKPYLAVAGTFVDFDDIDNRPTNVDLSAVFSSGLPTSSVNGEKIHYRTEEQEIGTWIDNKPLYRRTWDTTLASGAIFTLDSNILPKRIEVSMYYNDKSLQSNAFFYEGSNRWCVYIDNNVVTGIVPLAAYIGRKVAITIEYTKSDD